MSVQETEPLRPAPSAPCSKLETPLNLHPSHLPHRQAALTAIAVQGAKQFPSAAVPPATLGCDIFDYYDLWTIAADHHTHGRD